VLPGSPIVLPGSPIVLPGSPAFVVVGCIESRLLYETPHAFLAVTYKAAAVRPTELETA
jgi:hypothetical protein